MPAPYRALFDGHDAVLNTHRGWDPGALQLAREMAGAVDAPLFRSTTTRLLVDLNRSLGARDIWSEFTRALPAAVRREIVERHYRPHRDAVEGWVSAAVDAGHDVVHLASHSFTPELDGHVRTADVGLLYDSRRPREAAFSTAFIDALRRRRPELRLRRNYPYNGNSDGLCYRLRRRHPADCYIGIELEVNQQFAIAGGRAWSRLRANLVEALQASLEVSPIAPPR